MLRGLRKEPALTKDNEYVSTEALDELPLIQPPVYTAAPAIVIETVHVHYLMPSDVHYCVLSAYKHDFSVTAESLASLRSEHSFRGITDVRWQLDQKHMSYSLFPCGKDDDALVETLGRCCRFEPHRITDFWISMASSVEC
jgi:hypothetical protein